MQASEMWMKVSREKKKGSCCVFSCTTRAPSAANEREGLIPTLVKENKMSETISEPFDLELRGLSKHFGKVVAADKVDLKVQKGEFLSILGPSGCGKTTVLRMIAGFEEPTAGEILIKQERVNDIPPFQRNVGMVFQNYALFPHLDVEENLAFGLKIRKMSKALIKEKVERSLSLVRLSGKGRRRPSQLSGGEQQRIALARALIIEPDLILLDEPLSNLDAKLRAEMRVELKKIQELVGITSVFVTHDQEEALTLSDRIVVMNQGAVEQIGIPTDIYESPETDFVARFIGEGNFFEGIVKKVGGGQAVVELDNGRLTITAACKESVQVGRRIKVFVRPEHIDILPETQMEGENVFKAIVTFMSYQGSTCRYVCSLADSEKDVIICVKNDRGVVPFSSGSPIVASCSPNSCIIYSSA
jgi:spermidine/putrescine ABC transporter ATP-binding subunit